MGQSSGTISRRAPKSAALAQRIRSVIVRGELPPGAQLPPRTQMVKDFGTCKTTLQSALEELKDDGFVESRPSQGTFVAEKPPHLSHYGFVLAPDPGGLWRALTTTARREIPGIEKERQCRFVFYEDITEHPDTLGYQVLMADIKAHRLAGLIFRGNVRLLGLEHTPLVTIPGVPRLAITGPPYPPGITHVALNAPVFLDKALGYLAGRGRRRMAVLIEFRVSNRKLTTVVMGGLMRERTHEADLGIAELAACFREGDSECPAS